MKVGLVQYNPAWEDKNKNREKIDILLTKFKVKVDLLVFPEMTLTGFTMNASAFSETLYGESFKYFAELAKEQGSHIITGIIESNENKYYNSLLHINKNGELIKVYRKIHPFSYSTEDQNYTRGEKTVVTQIDGWNAGLSICYDLRFPELYRYYGKERAELIVVIANWPVTRIEHWRTLLKARAIENQCYVAGVNRVGDDPALKYNGFSSIFDPMGSELISSSDEETIISEEISIEKVKETREKLPFLDDIFLI